MKKGSKPVRVVSMRDADKYDTDVVINTTSSSKDWGSAFSPFFLGPVETYDGMKAENVENAWQYSKVYRQHVNKFGTTNGHWMDWRNEGWANPRAQRYPMGKVLKPLFTYWDGNKYGYIEARKKVYAPLYAQAVVNTLPYRKLKNYYTQGKEIVLIDYDGYDYLEEGLTLIEVINNPNRKMGHAFVLAMLLHYPDIEKRYRK